MTVDVSLVDFSLGFIKNDDDDDDDDVFVCLIQQQFRLSVQHSNASATVNAMMLEAVEVHGVDSLPASVTVDGASWNRFSHSATMQVPPIEVHHLFADKANLLSE